MYKFAIFGLFVAAAVALPTQDVKQTGGLDCLQEEELFSCLLVKASTALRRAARSSNIDIVEGITFVRDIPMEHSARSLTTETEVLNELPRDASDRTLKLVTMLYESAVSFLKSHSLKVNVAEESFSRALVEGRGKLKKVFFPLLAAAGVKIFALVPIFLGGLALLVLKALFVGKLALVLAGILAFQKLFGGSSGSSSSGTIGSTASNFFSKHAQPAAAWLDGAAAQGWNAGAAGQQTQQGYYKRSLDDAQTLAYSSHVPNTTE